MKTFSRIAAAAVLAVTLTGAGHTVDLVIHPLRSGQTGGDFVSAKLANGTIIKG